MNKALWQFACLFTLVGFLITSGGCQRQKITAKSVRGDMSPELQSIAHRQEQRKNMHARTKNTNWRQLKDDMDRILLMEKPSRLSEYPIP